jgi:cytochrome c oxidase cbb3-type subunit III
MNDENQEPRLLDHDGDGIQELDNLLPRWWVWLFWMCNVFAFLYMLYFHVLEFGDNQASAYAKDAQAGDALKKNALAKFESSLSSLEPSKDRVALEKGSQIYTMYCSPCHRPDGGGLVGPNLCDDYWIHGGTYHETLKTIINGVPEKGMLTWRGVLKPQEIEAVASHIYTLRGSTPPNAKPPENQQSAAPAVSFE